MENNKNAFLRKSASQAFSKIKSASNSQSNTSRDSMSRSSFSQSNNNSSEIEGKIKAIVVDKLNVSPSQVHLSSSFTNDLGADSLDAVELIMEFEKAFGINIPDEQAAKIRTFGDAVAYIEANAG